MRVGIIGAGAAGLAAGYELGKHGHDVTVYERSPFLGGQASTFDLGGFLLERGYHHLFTSDLDIIDLAEEIGLGDRIRWFDSTVGTFYGGRIYNFVTPLDLLKFTPLSFIDRLKLGLMTMQLQYKKDWKAFEDITADQWLREHVSENSYNVFWGPMLRGKFGEDNFRKVGMAWIWGKIQTRFASRGKGFAKEVLGYPIGSFGEIFDVLGSKIEEFGGRVCTSTTVTRVEIQSDRATGLFLKHTPATWISPAPTGFSQGSDIGTNNDQKGETESSYQSFDAIISTTPSYEFAKLVPGFSKGYLSKLNEVDYLAAVLLILVLKRPLSKVYWLNVADRSIPFVGVIEQTNLVNPEKYGGNHVVYISNYVSESDQLYRLDHQDLLEEYLPHLRKLNPEFDISWVLTSYHHKVKAAQPIIGVNHSSHIPDHTTPFKGLYLANTTQIYPEDRGTNYSVRIGKIAANLAMENFSSV